MIGFDEKKHIYFNDTGLRYISVTTLISLFVTPFDSERIAEEYLDRRPNDHRTIEQLLGEWDFKFYYAANRGSHFHNKKQRINSRGLNKRINNEELDLSNLKPGIYPELRLYNDYYELAGHADRVKINPDRTVEILDYKTNKKYLSKKNYGKYMKYPLNKIKDAKYFHYALQLNLYAWMLEQFNYIPVKLEIEHHRFVDTDNIKPGDYTPFIPLEEQIKPKIYEVKYRPDIVVELLDYYKKHGSNKYRESISEYC